ncbi:MAG: Dihydrolipoyllysine-residue succinyltransferase component of 2-oxoglutarate dehydrogenase complex [Alphaproteobacteria bacterium MarineAlpha10_Bin2]|nr:MAG: Dihydrolipoyllysine-residue succinyltransferase component of 2-oxoglutarate dehydrogenase complex [Alphaproteobacteria bacterium MarineAlpha10_Bin2]
MTLDITVPEIGESITEATVTKWFKAPGDAVARDELLVELETDKVAVEINAASAGRLADIIAWEGEDVEVGAVLGHLAEGDGPAKAPVAKPKAAAPKALATEAPVLTPAVRKLIEENALDANAIQGSGKDGRILKGDVLKLLEASAPATLAPETLTPEAPAPVAPAIAELAETAREERVPMSRLRQRVAERLKEAQNTAAMLTTFNEADMTGVIVARTEYRDAFEKKHGVRLGFMSFFIKAAIAALKDIPSVNAEIDGTDIVYKKYYHIGVAVSAPQGLVVPVLRDADKLGFAEIEKRIAALGAKAKDGKLSMDDLSGGTFTISNGGVFGSLMSTPILNPPQSGILGMHKIQERPIAVDGEMAIRPMMYLALSYDHRLIDGREAVTFLVRIKECIEAPERLLLDL